MLTGKQRAMLRGMANGFDVIYQIGKGGLSEESFEGIDSALEARELIKLRVLETSPYTAREASDIICERLGADGVSAIGRTFVLYRESKKKKQIEL